MADLGLLVRQELVQWWIEQPDGYRQPGHDLEQLDEVLPLHRQQLGEGIAAAADRLGADHLAHREDPFGIEEHVLGTAETDPLGAELAGLPGIPRCLGVGSHPQPASGVGPGHQRAELAGHFRRHQCDAALADVAGGAVDGDEFALGELLVADLQRLVLVVDAQRAGPGDARLAHAARHHCRVAGGAAARSQDADGGVHAGDVLRAGLDADQQHGTAFGLEGDGVGGGKHDLAAGSARRGGKSARQHIAVGLLVDGRQQQLIEEVWIDAQQCLVTRQDAFVGKIDGDLHRGLDRAFAGAGLQHPQPTLLDGELDVLHVAVVALELRGDGEQLSERLWHQLFERWLLVAGSKSRRLGDVLRRADSGNDVLALRIDQEFAEELFCAGRRITGKGDAGGAVGAAVAKYHRLYIDGGAPMDGDIVQPPVDDGAFILPGPEHGADSAPQLGQRIVRKRISGLALDGIEEGGGDRLPVVGAEAGIVVAADHRLVAIDDVLEQPVVEPEHHRGVHLNEAAVAVVGEPAVVGGGGQPLDGARR